MLFRSEGKPASYSFIVCRFCLSVAEDRESGSESAKPANPGVVSPRAGRVGAASPRDGASSGPSEGSQDSSGSRSDSSDDEDSDDEDKGTVRRMKSSVAHVIRVRPHARLVLISSTVAEGIVTVYRKVCVDVWL